MYCRQLYVFLCKLVLMTSLWFIGTNSAMATHALGGDISYTQVGPNQYEVVLTIFYDCNGWVTLGPTQRLAWTSPSGCGPNGQT